MSTPTPLSPDIPTGSTIRQNSDGSWQYPRLPMPSPVEQEITGNGSGASLPPFSNQPLVGEPLPLWLAMARAEAKESGSHAFRPNQFSGGTIKAWAPVIEALADWLLPDSDALPINELAAAQQHLRHALRARLLAQAKVAREAGPD